MDLYVNRLYLKNYRNFKLADLKFNPRLNLFIGKNAQGKTNILESLYYLGTGSSHRTNIDSDLIHWGSDYFFLKTDLQKRNRDMVISFGYNKSKKEIKIDSNPLNKISDLMGYINIVLFSPEDLQMVKGNPSFRRKFLNLEISQVNPYYHYNLQKYKQVVRQRNLLLKEMRMQTKKAERNRELLFVWDQQLSDLGSRLIKKRLEVVEKLDILARLTHRKITDGRETLRMKYSSSLGEITNQLKFAEIKEIFQRQLLSKVDYEIHRGSTLLGPHLDDLELLVNEINVRQYGSQGQQRTTALALKISELEFMKSEIGEYPILLLDDVFSELDSVRKSHLLEVIKDKIQTFITSTDTESVREIQGKYHLFTVTDGQVEVEKGCS